MLNKTNIRTEHERPSIRKFMEDSREYLNGSVLDFGCGEKPYRYLVSGEYTPYDLGYDLSLLDRKYDCIMCNQVMQYIFNPLTQMKSFYEMLNSGGYLVMTYPTHWEEVEFTDLWRFTKAGMSTLLMFSGFKIIKHEERCNIPFEDFKLTIGYGVIAKKY